MLSGVNGCLQTLQVCDIYTYSILPTITAAIPDPITIATIGYIMLYSWRCAVTRPVMNSIVRAMLMSVRFDTYIQVIIRCGYI